MLESSQFFDYLAYYAGCSVISIACAAFILMLSLMGRLILMEGEEEDNWVRGASGVVVGLLILILGIFMARTLPENPLNLIWEIPAGIFGAAIIIIIPFWILGAIYRFFATHRIVPVYGLTLLAAALVALVLASLEIIPGFQISNEIIGVIKQVGEQFILLDLVLALLMIPASLYYIFLKIKDYS